MSDTTDPTPASHDPDRRRLFRMGAAAAGAAAVSAVGMPQAHAEANVSGLGGEGDGSAGGSPAADAPSALPPVVPGTKMLGLASSTGVTYGFGSGSTATKYLGANGWNVTSDALRIFHDVTLPPGSVIVRTDWYGYNNGGSTTQGYWLTRRDPSGNSSEDVLVQAGSGTGALTATSTTPVTLAPGYDYYISIQAGGNLDARGAVLQYYPAGELLLVTPKRVYDSRPGFTPATGPKTKLLGGAANQRTIDCSSAVPPYANAVLVTLTVTNTSGGGFVSLFKAGIAWPGTSSINWSGANSSVATTQLVQCSAAEDIIAYCAPGESTDIIIDVIGYQI